MTEWTDERMDDLATRMDAGFERVDADLRELRGELHDARRELKGDIAELRTELKGDIGELRKTLTSFGIALVVGLIGVIGTLVGAAASGMLG